MNNYGQFIAYQWETEYFRQYFWMGCRMVPGDDIVRIRLFQFHFKLLIMDHLKVFFSF